MEYYVGIKSPKYILTLNDIENRPKLIAFDRNYCLKYFAKPRKMISLNDLEISKNEKNLINKNEYVFELDEKSADHRYVITIE